MKLFALRKNSELIARKHIELNHITEILSPLKIIVNDEFNLRRILKASNINSKIQVVSNSIRRLHKTEYHWLMCSTKRVSVDLSFCLIIVSIIYMLT